MNIGELIVEIIYQTRIEQDINNEMLLISHLQQYHNQDYDRLLGEKAQTLLECKQQRFKLEKELIQKYEGT